MRKPNNVTTSIITTEYGGITKWMHYLSKQSLYLYSCTDGLKTTNNFLRKGDSHYDEQ